MNSDVLSLPEADGQILTFDIPDEVLERAATPEQLAFTLVYCTHPWYNCGLPQQPGGPTPPILGSRLALADFGFYPVLGTILIPLTFHRWRFRVFDLHPILGAAITIG